MPSAAVARCHPQITHTRREIHTGRLAHAYSCTLCKYLLCVDEADEQDADAAHCLPLRLRLCRWCRLRLSIDEATRQPLTKGVDRKKCCTNNVIRLPHLLCPLPPPNGPTHRPQGAANLQLPRVNPFFATCWLGCLYPVIDCLMHVMCLQALCLFRFRKKHDQLLRKLSWPDTCLNMLEGAVRLREVSAWKRHA